MSTPSESGWISIGRNEDYGPGLHAIDVSGRKVVLAVLDDEVCAFDAHCPHARGPLEKAELDGTILTCPLHAWRFDLAHGGVEQHGYRPLPTRAIRLEHGKILIRAD